MSKKRSMTKTTGRGWVGRWRDGMLGWAMPEHLTGLTTGDRPSTDKLYIGDDADLFLCEITVKLLRRKDGKPITRKMRTFRIRHRHR